MSIDGAQSILLNVTGGPDVSLYEINEAAEKVAEAVDPEANIIFGFGHRSGHGRFDPHYGRRYGFR